MTHPSVQQRLERLTPDQRTAATAPTGPVLCVAPAGSGKTTTLVARIAWLVDHGVDPASITAITFNKRAAEELGERADIALAPLGFEPGAVRVRTFHALGREILREAGRPIEPLIDRAELLAELWPHTTQTERGRLDTAFSRLKLDLGVGAAAVAADPGAGPVAQAFIAYEAALAQRGGLDFDDLVRDAVTLLGDDEGALARWRDRSRELLVDEVQDVDRSQLRLALLLAAPANRIFLVGDDDQP
jgi:DNA helicase-2/ATP-dependent DNA helicase PcrA